MSYNTAFSTAYEVDDGGEPLPPDPIPPPHEDGGYGAGGWYDPPDAYEGLRVR